jgi:hypothetical protein
VGVSVAVQARCGDTPPAGGGDTRAFSKTQRYLNVTDEELRKGLEVSWNNQSGPLRIVSASKGGRHIDDAESGSIFRQIVPVLPPEA